MDGLEGTSFFADSGFAAVIGAIGEAAAFAAGTTGGVFSTLNCADPVFFLSCDSSEEDFEFVDEALDDLLGVSAEAGAQKMRKANATAAPAKAQ